MAEGYRRLFGVLVVLVAVFGATTLGGAEDGGAYIASTSPTTLQTTQASSEVMVPTTQFEAASPATTTTTSAPVTTTRPQLGVTAVPTTSPRPLTLLTSTTAPPPPTTSTTLASCRNSTEPACGPFRFEPQPGADNPMSVHIVVEPPAPTAGREVTFSVTLADPDGVSHASSTYNWGDSGIGQSSVDPCERYGPWDPPARDPARATEALTLRHTYAEPGTYKVVFIFGAGPFDCVDSVTGRGDRPYASSASGTVTIEVR